VTLHAESDSDSIRVLTVLPAVVCAGQGVIKYSGQGDDPLSSAWCRDGNRDQVKVRVQSAVTRSSSASLVVTPRSDMQQYFANNGKRHYPTTKSQSYSDVCQGPG
jgi:hypothetical protein